MSTEWIGKSMDGLPGSTALPLYVSLYTFPSDLCVNIKAYGPHAIDESVDWCASSGWMDQRIVKPAGRACARG